MKLYTVRDSIAGFFLPPFTAPNDNVAKRMFIGSLGDSFNYRQDFFLYATATFDETSGLIVAIEPELILSGSSIAPALDPRPSPTQAAGSAMQ